MDSRREIHGRDGANKILQQRVHQMKRDELFKHRGTVDGDFVFDVPVAEVFDDMLSRSIPSYHEQQWMVRELASSFWIPNTDIYDLGCSTATTLLNLCQDITPPSLCIGYDNSKPIKA